MSTVALFVTPHGFGHAVRCAEVARELIARGARVLLRSEAPAWLFPPGVEYLPSPGWPIDVGVAQRDGLELDIAETGRRWAEMIPDFDHRADVEAQLLRDHAADVVLGDIPPLAFAAAARAGIPGLALANFGWDWIYAEWPDFPAAVIRQVQAGYQQADLLLRLPLHSSAPDAFPAFRRVRDVPLIARRAQRPRAEVRTELGLPLDAAVVLLSFGGFHARGMDLAALGAWRDYLFLLTPPISTAVDQVACNVRLLPGQVVDYPSLLAACDVVVTKPGYGIVADCLANRSPVLYTDRGPFREYAVLAHALETLGRARYVPRPDVLAARLGPHLDRLRSVATSWTTQPMDGAAVVASALLDAARGCLYSEKGR